MKKVLVALLLVLCMTSSVYAGMILYENEDLDLKVSLEETSACVLYDFNAKQTLAGIKTPIVQYKSFNLDIGAIGDIDEIDDWGAVDAFIGLSYDIKAFKYNDNVYGDVGVFTSPGWLDDGDTRFGVYAGVKIKF